MKVFLKVINIRPEAGRSTYEQVEGGISGGPNP